MLHVCVLSVLTKIIKTGYSALQLEYFFTAGPDEVRAWTVRVSAVRSWLSLKKKLCKSSFNVILVISYQQKGTKAPQAAGKIHTDFEKGFIMAEVMKFSDFKEEGSESAVKVCVFILIWTLCKHHLRKKKQNKKNPFFNYVVFAAGCRKIQTAGQELHCGGWRYYLFQIQHTQCTEEETVSKTWGTSTLSSVNQALKERHCLLAFMFLCWVWMFTIELIASLSGPQPVLMIQFNIHKQNGIHCTCWIVSLWHADIYLESSSNILSNCWRDMLIDFFQVPCRSR